MGIRKTLGGDRLGTGKKMTVELENFGRSTFNLNKVIRFDQAFGTLNPAYCGINLNGGTFYIGINAMAKTLPTNGPIMARAKYQIDFFEIPIRLYIAALHNNALGIGMAMNKVYLPKFTVENIPVIDFTSDEEPNRQQVSQDSLLAFLGIRGLGNPKKAGLSREFPAIFMLAYWDIYKNYYSNKQEEIGCVITKGGAYVRMIQLLSTNSAIASVARDSNGFKWVQQVTSANIAYVKIFTNRTIDEDTFKNTEIILYDSGTVNQHKYKIRDIATGTATSDENYWITAVSITDDVSTNPGKVAYLNEEKSEVEIATFELENIDTMRENILAAPKSVPFNIGNAEPYKYAYENYTTEGKNACYYSMAGLGLKTYMSDRFNNWLSTEWIDGVNGVNEITAVDVSDGKLTMNALILSKKMFNMLNRIAISDGSYVSWQEAVWGVRAASMAESPIYCGGMSFDIVFDEVVSNSSGVDAEGNDQPLGTLAGRGEDKNKRGGRVKIKASEPCMIMAIASCTPYVDYSQGNKWWNELETMDDFHKPDLDRIGFQELLTEEFAAADTVIETDGSLTKNSVGKQTSWVEYQTDVNETFGDFAAGGALEWMAFNRKYHYGTDGRIEDATTYIDPTIYNVAFADVTLALKPLWMQIAFNIEARRVMGAKQIPNL